MTTDSPLILSFPTPHIACITLFRVHAANALNMAMAEAICSALANIAENKEIRVVILTGAGERAFCAGADLKERRGMDKCAWNAQHAVFERALHALLACEVPVIAAVNGAAFGGGAELAMACDLIYAADHARFALPEATLGIMPGMGGTQHLPRQIGMRRALEMLFTGAHISAEQAERWGLVNKVVPQAILMKETLALAEKLAANAPRSLQHIKRAVKEGMHQKVMAGLAVELAQYDPLIETKDRLEGIAAFNEKRTPVFTGK